MRINIDYSIPFEEEEREGATETAESRGATATMATYVQHIFTYYFSHTHMRAQRAGGSNATHYLRPSTRWYEGNGKMRKF